MALSDSLLQASPSPLSHSTRLFGQVCVGGAFWRIFFNANIEHIWLAVRFIVLTDWNGGTDPGVLDYRGTPN